MISMSASHVVLSYAKRSSSCQLIALGIFVDRCPAVLNGYDAGVSEAMQLNNGSLLTWASSDTLCDGKQLLALFVRT